MSFVLVYITFNSKEEAEKIAKILIEERLIACANLFPEISSFFWWEGKIEKEKEVALIGKTKEELFQKIVDRVKELHSYQCPCIIALPIFNGNPDFLEWIKKETQ